MEKDYNNNIDYILNMGKIENISLDNLDILKDVIKDDELSKKLYNEFKSNFDYLYEDDYLMKTQDLVYRLSLFINKCLLDKHDIKEIDDIKHTINKALDNGLDLCSAVSYDENDEEILDEFEYVMDEMEIKI